jgi:hypothetical protein
MAEFMPEPSLVLETADDLRAALADTAWMHREYPYSWRVKSVWLIGLIDEIVAADRERDFAYNLDVQRQAEARLGIPPMDENDSPLSRLVYNAQQYRRSDRLRAEGFEPFTDDLVARAWRSTRAIELQGENMLGGTVRARLAVRQIAGKLYAMPPKARKRYFRPSGQPARLRA